MAGSHVFNSKDCESVQYRARTVMFVIFVCYTEIKFDEIVTLLMKVMKKISRCFITHVTQAREARNVYRDELTLSQKGLVKFIKNDIKAEEYTAHMTFD
jgi:hypothetical protein